MTPPIRVQAAIFGTSRTTSDHGGRTGDADYAAGPGRHCMPGIANPAARGDKEARPRPPSLRLNVDAVRQQVPEIQLHGRPSARRGCSQRGVDEQFA